MKLGDVLYFPDYEFANGGHADKLFGGDIGSDDRSAYRPPGKPAPGEEIIAGIPLVPLPAA